MFEKIRDQNCTEAPNNADEFVDVCNHRSVECKSDEEDTPNVLLVE